MKAVNHVTLLVLILVMLGAGTARAHEATPPIKLIAAGSGVNLGITRLLADAFMKNNPGVIIDVPGSIGTRGAISATLEGAVSLGLISRPLMENERKMGLIAVPYARTAIVVAAHPSVVDEGITSGDLVDIFKGTKKQWKDGKDIVVLAREKTDSGLRVLNLKIPGFEEAYMESYTARRWSVFFTDQDANRALSTRSYAIGVTDTGMINTERLNVKVLKVDGLLPDSENVSNGQYPFLRDLSFIYREGDLLEGARAFLDFVKSEEGVGILRSNGYYGVD